MSLIGQSIKQAVATVNQGGVLVYPTEGVYGIGCDFRHQQAVEKILHIKQRSVTKGLILVASHIQQILPLIMPQKRAHLARALKTWPGHATWVFPAADLTPAWITGEHDSVAVRVSNHPVIKDLCQQLNHAVVSTSANISGQEADNNCQALANSWGDAVDYYLDLPLGQAQHASPIRMANTAQVLR